MNAAFRQGIGAKDDERVELFLASARRLHGAIRMQRCQPSPSFRFKVTMSGSNALRPLTFFCE